MNLIVIHTRSEKKHVADADVPESAGMWDRGNRPALCSPSMTFGKTADRWVDGKWRSRSRAELDADPWCRRCEKRARAEGVIA